MKFFEQMDTTERETMIRKAVAFNVSLEGMDQTAQAILQDVPQKKSKQSHVPIQPATYQTVE
jgi:hypothetical protein